jgi:citronellol/citronellal dehydrogenase
VSKFAMSLYVLGMASEFEDAGVAVNALWPRTTIDTEAIRLLAGDEARRRSRLPSIMADAAWHILTRGSRGCTGHFFVDDEVLLSEGVSDFSVYRHPGVEDDDLIPDFFV